MGDDRCQYCSNRATRNAHNRFNDAVEMVCEIHYTFLKPSSAKVNPIDVGRCIRCGDKSLDKWGEKERLLDHHVNYPLDLTVPVCDSCHQEIHNQETQSEKNGRWLEHEERTNEPFVPIGGPQHQGVAIHQDYKTDSRPQHKSYRCQDCGTHLIYPPDGMGHESPFICPNSDCSVIEHEVGQVGGRQ